MAKPSIVHHPAPLFDGSILFLDASGRASGEHFATLSSHGYHVVRVFRMDEIGPALRRHKDIVLAVIRQNDPSAQPAICEQMELLRAEIPWLEYLIVADALAPSASPDDADRIFHGKDLAAFLAVATEAYNLARMQQVQTMERHQLERSLREYKSRTDVAFAQLMAHMQRQPGHVPPQEAADTTLSREEIARLIQEECNRARIRERLFGPLALGHTGWLLVLALAEANGDGAELTVKSAAHTAGLPLSSALRKINELCERRLLSRRRDTSDARRSFISLTARTRTALQEYFAAVEAGHKR